MKTELASLDIHVIVRELRESLVGAYVDKAYQPSYDEIILTITGKGMGKRRLLVHNRSFHVPVHPGPGDATIPLALRDAAPQAHPQRTHRGHRPAGLRPHRGAPHPRKGRRVPAGMRALPQRHRHPGQGGRDRASRHLQALGL
ncbi:MAG: hypothetical protein GWN18_19845 [Thermoplasmata archaeon]|nr:hypothetical protein [Thermoplasmata archaeon]NIS11002.1 hypothetical protein [Thermoplasmata archaeon]NIS22222.1 hypothetical protein [Thermoplasmata archaeon]NIT75983.1 hypothetical protein [Thermoplasmata archaeon]NIU51232.1 hypothetical protein [Thermoplasmata archaeon]